MKRWWREHRPEIIGDILFYISRLLHRSLRLTIEGEERMLAVTGGRLLLSWHGRSYIGGQYMRGRKYWVIVSQSRDGDIQNGIFQKLGYESIRGSTGRNGERALIEAIRCLKKGHTMAITPDGPRGPSGVLQAGVLAMARKSGAAIIPVGCSAKPNIVFKSWDHHQIPLPFAKSIVIYGDPIYVPVDADGATLEEYRLRVEEAIHEIEREADRKVGLRIERSQAAGAPVRKNG